jgi:dTMP kinase
LRVLTSSGETKASFLALLRNRNFLRLFLAQFVSSLGDWIGVFAIAAFAYDIGGNVAVGTVMAARVLPGFIAGPVAGVMADRFDRRKLMVYADVARAALIFSLPFVQNLAYLLLVSVLLEVLTLVWGPAKDASLPHVVSAEHITHANSLNLIAVYGPWPLGAVLFGFMAKLGEFLGDTVPVLKGLEATPEALALWIDSITFAFSALMIFTLSLPASRRRAGRFDLTAARRDLIEGLNFVKDHKQVRPWLLGIALTFMAAGAVFSVGIGFVDRVLGGGQGGFAFLVGFLATGMIIGLLSVGAISQRVQKDILFSSSLLLLGGGLIALASTGSLNQAIPFASALGFFAGAAYATGYSLMHEATSDELRGRTFSAAYTIIRIGMLVGLSVFPFAAGAIGNYRLGSIDLPDSRVTLLLAGLLPIGGGLLSMRAIGHRVIKRTYPGYFVVFEGGEGAGKSTQLKAFVEWLEARGVDVVTTREPGGTAIGERIRSVVLDGDAVEMDERTEALLYAADRAQHVNEVIAPALKAGKVVVSDRYVDSSLAYQGLARGLGLEEIYRISEWATEGLLPDLVYFLSVDPAAGLARAEGTRDRIEEAGDDFHAKVKAAYLQLAKRYPARFVVVDATRSKAEVHAEIVGIYERRAPNVAEPMPGDLGPPGPVPR